MPSKYYSIVLMAILSIAWPAMPVLAADKSTEEMDLKSITALVKRGQYTDAIAAIEMLEDLDKNWQANFWLGTAYLLNGQLSEAAHTLDYALELEGSVAAVWLQRAIVEQQNNNPTAALQLLQVAVQTDPSYAKSYLNIAYAYEHLGKPEAARAAYGYFLKLSTHNPHSMRLRQQVISRLVGTPKSNKLLSQESLK